MSDPLLSNVEAFFPEGTWTGLVGPNGSGKTTLLRLASEELEPSTGRIERLGKACYALQRTDSPPPDWLDFLDDFSPEAVAWRNRLGIQLEWADRWDTLSHGERKRLQIAVALWNAPAVLALDEPTNHLDAQTRDVLLQALRQYRGVGLLVSHDRALLDALCSQCLFLFPPTATMRPGGVSQGMEQSRLEQASARARDNALKADSRRLREQSQARRETAEQMAARHKAGQKKPPMHDHDGRAQRRLATLTGKDSWAVKQSAQLARRAASAAASRASIPIRKEYEMGFWIEGASRSQRDSLLTLEAGELPLGDGRTLHYPDLVIRPTDRIALLGPNGSGKSSLLRFLLPRVNVPAPNLLSIPQEISEEETRRIHTEAKTLPKEALGSIMTRVSALGSRPGRLLDSECPSPGEIRKLLLALGVERNPHLIVLDEPTNHLDLPSIECLEGALSTCPCALLLVSHDAKLVHSLAFLHWVLTAESSTSIRLSIEYGDAFVG